LGAVFLALVGWDFVATRWGNDDRTNRDGVTE
jgi:hypothetical protein